MNMIEELESEQIAKLTQDKPLPDFAPGDTVRVHVKVVEGTTERIQAYEGICIARRNRGLNSVLYRPQDLVWRGRGTGIPTLFAED